jgi:hypothetical protein
MNARIKALAEQAIYIEEPDGLFPREVFDREKFAELIVRECMLQCIKVENDVELSDYKGGFKDGALLCYQEIQEHFGVEK